MKLKSHLVFVIFLVSAISICGQALRGRVVDKKGAPISNATVGLVSDPCRDCIDHVTPYVVTDENGFFSFSRVYHGENARLFVEEDVPFGYWNPIYAPQVRLSGNPRFRGTPVNVGESNFLDVGQIEPTVKYENFNISIHKVFARNYQLPPSLLKDIRLSVIDNRGELIDEKRIPDRAITDNREVNLVLPQGIWNLHFSTGIADRPLTGKVLIDTIRRKTNYLQGDRLAPVR